MPKLELGHAFSKGVASFIQGYTQGKQLEQQEKMQKHQIILQALNKQLEDDTIPYSQRAKIVDSIPQLLGIKMDTPLSQQMGLHELLDDDVEIEAEKSGVDIENDEFDVQAARTKKRGDMSPLEYKSLVLNKSKEADAEADERRILNRIKIQQELSDRAAERNGWEKNGDWVFDEERKKWKQVYFNPRSGESRTQEIDGTPQAVVVAKEKAKASANRLTPSVRMLKEKFINDGLDEDAAEMQALNLYAQGYEVDATTKQLRKRAVEQTTTGTTPLTTGDRIAIRKQHEDREVVLLKQKQDIEREARASSKLTSELATQAIEARRRRDEAKKALDNYIRENGDDASDDSQRLLNAEYLRQEADFDRIQKDYNKVNAEDQANKERFAQAIDEYENHKKVDPFKDYKDLDKGTETINAPMSFSPEVQNVINQIRKKNPAKTKGYSDLDIYNAFVVRK